MKPRKKNVPQEGDGWSGERHEESTLPEGMEIDQTIDVRTLGCPGPLLELIKTMKGSPVGTVIELLLTDYSSVKGIPVWVSKSKHQLVQLNHYDGYARIVVKKIR